MKITKVKINNFRLLKNFQIDLEDELSLVIGKNNCGKTSFLAILDKFIGSQSFKTEFYFDDFNIEFKNELKRQVESNEAIKEEDFPFLGISLKLFISYDEDDNLSNVKNLMMDLDPKNKMVVLAFEYSIIQEELKKLKQDFNDFTTKQLKKEEFKKEKNPKYEKPKNEKSKDIFYFLKDNHSKYFKLFKKAIEFNMETSIENDKNYIDLITKNVDIKSISNYSRSRE